jgi:hypothetical protein
MVSRIRYDEALGLVNANVTWLEISSPMEPVKFSC